jgi:subtilase family serine protease
MFSHKPVYLIIAVLILAFLVVPVSALYDFEGLPLTVQAQGQVNGDLLTFGKYGLENPPYSLQFELPAKPQYARVYTGIWGGTEKYTGSAEININNLRKITYTLNGNRDVNRDVYEAGHGVYWIAYDATDVLKKGTNLVVVNTSKGDAGNKLDGRVYGLLVVAAVNEPGRGIVTQYWITEGNEDLHGEGWAGTNPTRHDEANVTFTGADLSGVTSANLTTLEIAGTRGQPDYVEFNNHILGTPLRTENGTNVTDIGDERSFDATGGTGIDSRYTDAEVFTVNNLVSGTNTVRFIRGIDLNGDGVIATTGDNPEGEDYIHPVSAILSLTRPASTTAPDLAVDHISIENAYEGETATITAEIRDYGAIPESPATVTFLAGSSVINTTQAVVPPSGIAQVSTPWKATAGTVTVTARVSATGDTQDGNNEASQQLTIGTPPDLSVSIGSPVHKSDAADATATKAPLTLIPVLAGLCMVFMLRRRGPGAAVSLVVVSLVLAAGVSAVIAPAGAETSVQEYVLPLQITNSGGSDAPAFTVSVYLDGEKIADKTINGGVKTHDSATISIPVFTTPGSHEIRVAVDEAGVVKDANPANNIAQGRYDFPQ